MVHFRKYVSSERDEWNTNGLIRYTRFKRNLFTSLHRSFLFCSISTITKMWWQKIRKMKVITLAGIESFCTWYIWVLITVHSVDFFHLRWSLNLKKYLIFSWYCFKMTSLLPGYCVVHSMLWKSFLFITACQKDDFLSMSISKSK